MQKLSRDLFDRLTTPGPRLPWIKTWLLDEVWSRSRYEELGPKTFLYKGEEIVNQFEQLIAASADRTYNEFLSGADHDKTLLSALSHPDRAVVVFDGLSLREIPMVLNLAEKSGLKIIKTEASHAALPSETMDYIERELPCGRIAPSQLPTRKELKGRGIQATHISNYAQPAHLTEQESALLVWSSFPDLTYTDSGAKFESHFENIHTMFQSAWINTVQRIKGKKRITVTSDHGYVFFGTGLDFPRTPSQLKELNQYFGNERSVCLEEKKDPPKTDDILVDPARKVAVIKGRVRSRSTGEGATRIYKHGGLSLMEMLTPWIEMERV